MKKRKYQLLTYGELLLRLSPEDNLRLSDAGNFRAYIGGAEFNVAAAAAQLGINCGILSKIPSNSIGMLARSNVRAYGVSDEYLVEDHSQDARLGIYYYENGAYPRKPGIVYDRRNSSINQINIDEISEEISESCECFFTSGITLALSEACRTTGLKLIQRLKENGTKIAFDVNYRANLWSGVEARTCIEGFLPYVDIFFCSEDTATLTFEKSGTIQEMMQSFADEYQISVVASTRRVVHSPKRHTFSSILYDAKNHIFLEEEPYCDIEVADRIGSGDAYVAGVLYGLLSEQGSCEKAIAYGNAVSAVKNTMAGDVVTISKREADELIEIHKSPENEREMTR